MADSAQDKHTKAAIARALESLDAAFGRPYEALPLPKRVDSFFGALRNMPLDAIEWATATACARLERMPFPAQLRRLAQASPAYTAIVESKRTLVVEPPQPDVCADCLEMRAFHRITVMERPMVVRVIRHRSTCPHATDAPWMDPPPKAGTLRAGDDAWRLLGIDWTPPREKAQEAAHG